MIATAAYILGISYARTHGADTSTGLNQLWRLALLITLDISWAWVLAG